MTEDGEERTECLLRGREEAARQNLLPTLPVLMAAVLGGHSASCPRRVWAGLNPERVEGREGSYRQGLSISLSISPPLDRGQSASAPG